MLSVLVMSAIKMRVISPVAYDQSCYFECHMLRAVLPGIAKLNNTILLCNN
jgi:hypothetical protein